MTATPYDQPRRRHLAGWLPFIRHYIEMLLAMAIGMVALHPLWTLTLQAAGAPHLLDHAELMALVMATDMAIAMGAVMAYRRHGWRDKRDRHVRAPARQQRSPALGQAAVEARAGVRSS